MFEAPASPVTPTAIPTSQKSKTRLICKNWKEKVNNYLKTIRVIVVCKNPDTSLVKLTVL